MDNSVVISGAWQEGEEGSGGYMVIDEDLTWGGEHTTQGTQMMCCRIGRLKPVSFC